MQRVNLCLAEAADTGIVGGEVQPAEPSQRGFDLFRLKTSRSEFAAQLPGYRAGVALPIIFLNIDQNFKHMPPI